VIVDNEYVEVAGVVLIEQRRDSLPDDGRFIPGWNDDRNGF